MAKKHNVKVCKSSFKLVGNVKGTKSDRFFRSTTFDSGRTKNQVSFALQSSVGNENYVQLEGFDMNEASFSKWDKDSKTNDVKKVPWDDRFEFSENGYNPFFGIRMGLELDDKGKSIVTSMFQYDACQEIGDNLTDGVGLYTEGEVQYKSYIKDGERKRQRNLVPQKIYMQSKPVDFESEKFKEENRFEQELVWIGIDQEKDPETDKPTGRFIVTAKIVTRESVEDAEFIVEDKSLANNLKKNMKPYYGINVLGRIITRVEDAEEEEDAWGEDDDMGGNNVARFRELVITKAYPASIDKESYSEEKLASIKQAEDDFGDDIEESGDDEEVWGED